MRIAKCFCQRLFVFGHNDPVDVIAHQAIGPHFQAILLPVLIEEREVSESVGVLVKDIRAPIAPLRDVVRKARNDDAGQARHARSFGRMGRRAK